MNLLLVDDDPDARLLAGWTLEREGWTVSTAEDAATAETQLRETPPDVLLLDYFLGDDDGLELLGHWRAAGLLGSARVIVLSGKGSALEGAARAQGALGVIAKPFDPTQLAQQIRDLLPSS